MAQPIKDRANLGPFTLENVTWCTQKSALLSNSPAPNAQPELRGLWMTLPASVNELLTVCGCEGTEKVGKTLADRKTQ